MIKTVYEYVAYEYSPVKNRGLWIELLPPDNIPLLNNFRPLNSCAENMCDVKVTMTSIEITLIPLLKQTWASSKPYSCYSVNAELRFFHETNTL